MLGYTESDLNKMINAVHDAKLFYLRTPSDLMDKTELRSDLEMAVSFLQGLWAEGYFDNANLIQDTNAPDWNFLQGQIVATEHLLSVATDIMNDDLQGKGY